MTNRYSTILLEHEEVRRIRRRVWQRTLIVVLFVALAYLLWRVWG